MGWGGIYRCGWAGIGRECRFRFRFRCLCLCLCLFEILAWREGDLGLFQIQRSWPLEGGSGRGTAALLQISGTGEGDLTWKALVQQVKQPGAGFSIPGGCGIGTHKQRFQG
jgi:hypothetical protein